MQKITIGISEKAAFKGASEKLEKNYLFRSSIKKVKHHIAKIAFENPTKTE